MHSLEAKHFEVRHRLAHPDPDDEIVISGMSGFFPNSRNVVEYGQNIMNKINLCDDDERRHKHTISEVPRVTGKMFDIASFDAGFFGIHELHAHARDPMHRLILERAHEAILDAGIAPEDLAGTKTGVFIANSGFEAQKHHMYQKCFTGNNAILGFSRTILAQHISYFYKLNGPSMCLDTACSSGLYALDLAYMAIRNGTCNRAIVGGCSCLLNYKMSLQFMRLGVLNSNGECRPFDDDASGYTRSETVCILIIEKSKYSKRVYAKIVHSKTNIDGFKVEGITYPSSDMQMSLLQEVYNECGVPLDKIGYLEAHGTGTSVGDIEELCGIDTFFNKEQRKGKPLIIGSVKGNIGHTEQVAGLTSIIKVIYGMENDVILPNIHYAKPKRGADGLLEGRLKVPTEVIPWPEDAPYSGVNAFGFGGANGHVVLKRNEIYKTKKNDKLPRLVCFSGRTNEAIYTIQEYLSKNEINNDLIGLLHSAYSKRIANNAYRGFSVLSHVEEHIHSSAYCFEESKHLGLCIGDAIKINMTAFTELNNFPIFQKSVQKFLEVLQNTEININILSNSITQIEELMFNTCVQIGIIDILTALDVVPTYITGNSLGYFIAAYADQALTLEEVITSIYNLRNLFTQKDLEIDRALKDELKGVIAKSSKRHERYLKDKSNPYDFRTIEYFVHNIKNPNRLYNIEKGIELHLNGPEKKNIQLINSNFKVETFLQDLGRLYEAGFELNLLELYPKCSWPVPRGTPMISSLVKWDHNKQYELPNFEFLEKDYYGGQSSIECNLNDYGDSYMKGHIIDGRNLFPATAYIMYIAKILATFLDNVTIDQMVYQFSNVKFRKATTFGKNGIVELNVLINKSGNFEISENEVSVVTGEVLALKEEIQFEIPEHSEADLKMDRKDIYKELRLRGYNYNGEFCGIKEICGNKAILDWSDNFVTFLDNMLQFYILQKDNRSLYVPTGIDKLTLNIPGHKRHVKAQENDEGVAIFMEKKSNILRTQFIEMVGVEATAIARKKQIIDPILETYKFIPNESELPLDDALRVNTQIILENSTNTIFSVLENITEEREPFAPIVEKTLDGQPLILYNVKIISDLNIDFGEVNVVKENIQMQSNNNIFIGTNLLAEPKKMETVLATLVDNGFIITFETAHVIIPANFTHITKYKVANGILYLLTKAASISPSLPEVHISSTDFKWMNILKKYLQSKTDVIIYSENDVHSGIIGFSNCLRYEYKNKIYSFLLNGAPAFEKNSMFYKMQLKKNLRINVYKNGQWGTYRHMLLDSTEQIQTEHCFANVIRTGDLSSLSWIAGPLSKNSSNIVDIHYSSVNFKDLMIASGKVSTSAFAKNPVQRECFIGFEFSGINQKGERIMGIVESSAIASFTKYDPEFSWRIPHNWSLEEAATVPVVYSTVLLALKIQANIKKGESILIHSGTGGIGLSAINIALYYGLTVYTTVGTQEKREFLIKNYPQLDSQNIGNSRDTSFEQMIFKRTKGRGVDYVLNSLAEEKLLASLRCLSKNGTFLEIGKFDLSKNSELGLEFQNKGITYFGVMLDKIMESSTNNNKCKLKTALCSMVQHGICNGYIKPLPTTCFQMNQLQEAFKYIGIGKHIGKVIFKIKAENQNKPYDSRLFSAIPRVYFNPNASYIIIGGLGGFGLELVDWMVTRGARNLILSSRNGLKNGYQTNALRKLKADGVRIEVLKDDVTKLSGCLNIVNTSNRIAPIEGIFNLAVDLRDGIFDNLTENDYILSLNPKAVTSILLDEVSKMHCPHLKYFILFSSVSCGRGNACQTNYGMANSIMERLCERRKAEGLPALAIQWGAIGDVGLVAEMQKEQNEIVIGGTLQQRINSCLEVLDKLLYSSEAVVASMVVAEKTENKRSDNVVDAVLNVIGIRDVKTISPHASLPELGMDSMMAVEIKNILERDFDKFLTSNDIKTLTVKKLIDMQNDSSAAEVTSDIASLNLYIDTFFNNSTYKLPKVDIVEDIKCRKVFFFPGIEGVVGPIKNLMVSTSKNSTCFQYINCATIDVAKCVDELWPHIVNIKEDFQFVAHSVGTIFALELAAKMERQGHYGKIVIIDGSPDLIIELGSLFISETNNDSDTKLLDNIFKKFIPPNIFSNIKDEHSNSLQFSSLLEVALNCIPAEVKFNKEIMFDILMSIYKILKMALKYKPSFTKIKSEVVLIVPTQPTINNFADDLHLSKYCENILEISNYEGDHSSILNNSQVHDKITEFINN